MRYDLKPWPELYWAIGTALAFVLFTELAGLNPEGISDWKQWATALAVAMFRAVGGAGLDWVRRNMMAAHAEERPSAPEPILSETLIDQVADELERRLKRTPAGDRP